MTALTLAARERAGLAGDPFDNRPQVTFDVTKVYVFETRTGRVISVVPHVGVPRWSTGLNAQGDWSVSLWLRDGAESGGLAPADLEGLSVPWRLSYAVAQGDKIWQAGPLVTEDYQEGQASTSMQGGGLWKLLSDKRLLINPGRASLSDATSTGSDTVFGPAGYTPVIGGTVPAGNQNLSLHTISKRIVQTIESAPGGDLPVVYPNDIAGSSIREYPGYDLASPGQRLLDLSQVIGGPETEFAPEFADPLTKQSIQWRMRIGDTENNGGRLGNPSFGMAWDLGKALVDVAYGTDGSKMATRDFERGNGMNRDLLTGFADSPINTQDAGALLLETSGGLHTSVQIKATLNQWASAAVAGGLQPIPKMVAKVRTAGDDGAGNVTRSPHQSGVFSGDTGVLNLRGHRRLRDGAYFVRVVGRSSGPTADTMYMTCQLLGVTYQ